MEKRKLTVIDLFSGCGGISKGFEDAGFEILLGIDNWDDALKTFEHNHKTAKAINEDIFELTGDKIKEYVGNKKIDLVVGGPPCQGFSLAGNRNENDERNLLVFHFARIVNELKPKAFVMENVLGILSMAGGKIKKDLIKEFEEIGYNVIEPKALYAHHYGVPQMRRRVIFLGIRKDLGKFPKHPTPTHYDKETNQLVLVPDKVKPTSTVGDAISDLQLLDDWKGEEEMDYESPPKSEYQKEMRKNSKRLHNHTASNHTEQTKKSNSLSPRRWKLDRPSKRISKH